MADQISERAMFKNFCRLSKLINEAETDLDWEEVEALRANIMSRLMLEFLEGLAPEERDAVLAPVPTAEEHAVH